VTGVQTCALPIYGFDASFNATSLFNTSYVRDKLGRITQKTETIEGSTLTTDYIYDLAGRLISESTGGVTTSYTYDSNGNRTHIDGVLVGTYDDQDRLNICAFWHALSVILFYSGALTLN
jgi:YD repeat-containing protein